MNVKKIYRLVYDDLIKNGPALFRGIYDAENGSETFMHGIETVIEYIAYNADRTYELADSYNEMFINGIRNSDEYRWHDMRKGEGNPEHGGAYLCLIETRKMDGFFYDIREYHRIFGWFKDFKKDGRIAAWKKIERCEDDE